jgi:hypothetical protein
LWEVPERGREMGDQQKEELQNCTFKPQINHNYTEVESYYKGVGNEQPTKYFVDNDTSFTTNKDIMKIRLEEKARER